MHLNRLDRPRPAARASRLALLLCLLALAALTAACPEPSPDENQNVTKNGNDNSGQGVTEDPEPSTGADDRPIIITGGSLNVYFNRAAYAAVGGTTTQPQKFRLNGFRLAGMRAYNDDMGENSTVICEPTLGDNTSVNVTYAGGGPAPSPTASPSGTPAARQLTVTSGVGSDGASFVEVTMDTSSDSLPQRPSSRDMNFNRSARLESLTYVAPGGGAATPCTLPPNRKATIEISVARARAAKRP